MATHARDFTLETLPETLDFLDEGRDASTFCATSFSDLSKLLFNVECDEVLVVGAEGFATAPALPPEVDDADFASLALDTGSLSVPPDRCDFGLETDDLAVA